MTRSEEKKKEEITFFKFLIKTSYGGPLILTSVYKQIIILSDELLIITQPGGDIHALGTSY